MANRSTLDDLLAGQEIRDLIARYFRYVDRKDFEQLRSVYHPDAYDNHGLYAGDVDGLIKWLTTRHAAIVQSTHLVGNCLITRTGDVAYGETYGLLIQHEQLDRSAFSDGSELYRRMLLGVRYADRFEKRDGEWRIARHEVIYEWSKEELANLRFDSVMTVAQRSAEDLSYAFGTL
jgi:ketosteroid isomerase-like protein